ncbi:hypothetical protein FOZ62_010650, partial [Perkinsus olseni]
QKLLIDQGNGAACYYGWGELDQPYRQSLSVEADWFTGLRTAKIVCPRDGTRKAFSSTFAWFDGKNALKEYNLNYPYATTKSSFGFSEDQKNYMAEHLEDLGQHGEDAANELRVICVGIRATLVEKLETFDNLCDKVRDSSAKAVEYAELAGRRLEEKDGQT